MTSVLFKDSQKCCHNCQLSSNYFVNLIEPERTGRIRSPRS